MQPPLGALTRAVHIGNPMDWERRAPAHISHRAASSGSHQHVAWVQTAALPFHGHGNADGLAVGVQVHAPAANTGQHGSLPP